MNEKVKNLRVFHVLRILLNVVFWLILAVSVIFLVLLIINPGFNTPFSLSFDGFVISSEAQASGGNFSLYNIMVVMVLLVGVLCIWMLKSIVKSLCNSSPFVKENVKRIRIIGWALLIQAYLKQFLYYAFAKSLMDASLLNGVQPALQPRLNIIPEGALLALFVLILAEIFNYGCTLQHEHDTTV